MKKSMISFLVMLTFVLPCTAHAKTVEFIIGDNTMNTATDYVIESQELPASPFIAEDRAMVPVRAISESFGAKVSWTPETRTVSIVSEEKNITLIIDSNEAQVNGETTILDVAPVIVGDITFVPVRFVTESMGYYVYFVSSINSILVGDMPPVGYVNDIPLSYEEFMARYLIYAQSGNAPEMGTIVISSQMQNTVLSHEAEKAGISLSAEDKAFISGVLPYSGLLNGQVAMIQQKEFLSKHYADLLKQEALSDGSAEKAYTSKYLCAKHILIPADIEDASSVADMVYLMAKTEDDFDALIAVYGQDPGMITNPDGYIFTDGEMVAPFEEAVKSLQIGEISQPVQTEYGYHVILRLPLPEQMPDFVMQNLIWDLKIEPILNQIVFEQGKN